MPSMINFLESERQYCCMVFAECYAKESPVPPAWVEYSDTVKRAISERDYSGDFNRPESEEYPCRWVEVWRGWKQLEIMGLAKGLQVYLDTLPIDIRNMVKLEVKAAKWWIEDNVFFKSVTEYFQWTTADLEHFFNEAKKIKHYE